MDRKRIRKSGVYPYDKLPWRLTELRPVYRGEDGRPDPAPPPISGDTKPSGTLFRLNAEGGRGKISDAGYDQALCSCIALPADRDLTVRAVFRITARGSRKALTLQEGAGVFLRDTMRPDPATGFPYANMAFAGYACGGWTAFVRTGVGKDLEQVRHRRETAAASLHQAEETGPVEVVLKKTGGVIRVRIRPFPAPGSGPEEAEKALLDVCLPLGPDALRKREKRRLYLGFLSANICGLEIRKDRTSIELGKREKRAEPLPEEGIRPDSRPSSAPDGEALPPAPGEEIFVSPEGRAEGAGTAADPTDIRTAVRRCGNGQTVSLLPGRYPLTGDLLLPAGNGGRGLKCRGNSREFAVLDFLERPHGLVLQGSDWEIEGVAVLRGNGFQIEGKRNRIRRCVAARNLETGFLIRHQSISADPALWPSDNEICDCASFCNMDPSEHNADGFACKVAAGGGNVFRRCRAFLNSDDGFDLFSKNRATGPVLLEECASWLNGYCLDGEGLRETQGNGNGFKLGGSGQRAAHRALRCRAMGNRSCGFTSNSNPWMYLEGCLAGNNGKENYKYYFASPAARAEKAWIDCEERDLPDFDPLTWLSERTGREELWLELREENSSSEKASCFSTR